MGVFARVRVDNSIDLPHFPEELDRTDMVWQSKRGVPVHGGPYRVTSDGRLEQHQTSYREKTAEEKQNEAEKWGFDSWDEYVQAYEDGDGMIPDVIDYDLDEDDEYPPVYPSEKVVDETWWADYNMHGTFEFHQSIKRDPIEYEEITDPLGEEKSLERPSEYALSVYLEYEARFTKGDLDEIVFMGSRMGYADDPVEYALEQIAEWREWKAIKSVEKSMEERDYSEIDPEDYTK